MMQVRRFILLFIFALCMISCSNTPTNRISASRTPIPEENAAAIALEASPTPAATATPEPAIEATPTGAAPAGPDVNAILSKAMSMMASVGTFHFVMDRHFFNENKADELAVHIPVKGKFNHPDRIQGTVILSSHEETAVLDFIIIGEELYLRGNHSENWQLLDWGSQAAQIVRENAFLPLEQFSWDNFHEPELVGEVDFHGQPAYHVRGAVGTLAEGQANPGSNTIEFWIDKENHRIYRIISEMDIGDSDDLSVNDHAFVQIDYTNFGEPVLIVAPMVDETGGFRPTGSYPSADLLDSLPGRTNMALPADELESASPVDKDAASSKNASQLTEESLD